MTESSPNFCRVCFIQNDESFTGIAGTLTQMELLSVGNIEVFEEDGLPNLICKTCKIILSNCYKFKQVCKRSETLLKTFPLTNQIPPKLHIIQEPLPSFKKDEPVKLPEPKEMKSIGVGTDIIEMKSVCVGIEIHQKSISVGSELEVTESSVQTETIKIKQKSVSVGTEVEIKESSVQTETIKVQQKSVCVGIELEVKESSVQTDIIEPEPSIEQMEMIITNEDENFEAIPIIAPPSLFEDEQQLTIIKPEERSSKPKILLNERIKILNKATPGVSSSPAKQFKKKSQIKLEKSSDTKPTILNSQLKISQIDHQIIETIEETPDGSIEIIAYDEEYLDEDIDKKDVQKIEEMDKSEDGVVYSCDVCERGFPLLQQLQIHKENHTRARDHPCEYCDKAFFTKYDLAKHILTHTKQKDYTCVVCNKSFSRSTLLYRHEKIHTDPDIPRYSCSQCDRVYLNKLDYEKHQLVHNKSRPFACNYCDKKFAFKQGLERHEVIHDMQSMPHPCQYCSDRFKTAARLQRHLSSAHAGTRAFPCSKCNKRFMLSHHLYRHMRTSHKNEDEAITLQCPECEENFDQREVFFDHCLDHATVSLICPMCKYEGDSIDDINSHVLLHSKRDMYFCDYCSCIFMSQEVLNDHFVEKHSEELCGIVEDEIEYVVDNSVKPQIKHEIDKTFKTPQPPSKKQKITHEAQYIESPMTAASFVEYEEEIPEPIKVEKTPAKAVNISNKKEAKTSPTTTIQRVKMSLSEIKRLQKEGKIVMQDGMLVMKQ